MRILERLSRFFLSERARRERDAAALFLNVNDAPEAGKPAADAREEDALDAYFEFMEADPENAEAMRELNALWDDVAEIKNPPYPSAQELEADTSAFSLPLSVPAAPMTAFAASLAVFGAVAAGLLLNTPPAEDPVAIAFSTERGEMRPVVLEDGSTVTLGGATRITVAMNETERKVTLLNGDSYMTVAPDRARAFTVRAGAVSVRAVGTAFSVNKSAGGIAVAVSEGVVEVSSSTAAGGAQTLTAGEQLRFSANGLAGDVAPITMGDIAPWRRGQLILNDQTLAYAVDAIHRYYDGAIAIEDPRLETMRASGVIDIYAPGPWLEGLQNVLPVEVRQTSARGYSLAYREIE